MTQDTTPPEEEPEAKAPRIEFLGKYRVLEEIGRGGMAVVFRAEDTETGRIVAAKALLPELAAQPAFIKRFRREVETHQALDHEAIVPILDVGKEGDYQYYIMEYMDGPSVEKQMRLQGKFELQEAIKVVRAVSGALQYAHARGVVHRDIKPANIMTSTDGTVKLADFGIAKDIDATRLTVTGGIVGTADYMSPEQAEGRRVTRKSDIYSVGVCLYHMLTGRLPFVGKTYLDVIRAHRFSIAESPRRLNPSIPPRIGNLVESMMEKDPDKRPSSAAEVLAQLDLVDRSHGVLTDEERDGARELVRWALVPELGWRGIVLRIIGGVAAAVVLFFVAKGMHYRYFTTSTHKFALGMEAFEVGDFRLAGDYFKEVIHFHPEAPEAALAEQRIEEIRYRFRTMEVANSTPKSDTPDMMHLYNRAMAALERGEREKAVKSLQILAGDFPATEGGALAALRLKALSEGEGVVDESASESETPEDSETEESEPTAE